MVGHDQEVAPVAADSGSERPSEETTQTVEFGLDGQNYAIDLNDEGAAELRAKLDRFIAAGRPANRRTRPATSAPTRPPAGQQAPADGRDNHTVRQWARAHGHQVADRGPIPATIRQAYDASRHGLGS